MAVPNARPKLRTAFKNAKTIAPLYTAGPVAVTSDGTLLISCVAGEILLTELATGMEICRFSSDAQTVHSLCVSASSSHLMVFTASLALRIYEIPKTHTPLPKPVQPIRVIARAHDAPVHVCKTDPTSTYLASGSADGIVKVWDIARGYVTHVFRGHGGVVSALAFNYPQDHSSVSLDQNMQLITASVDTRIRIFDLTATANAVNGAKPSAVLEGHVSVPRGLDVSRDGKWLVSGGRDSVVLIWDLTPKEQPVQAKSGKGKEKERAVVPTLAKTIPILERVEAVGLLSPQEDLTGSTSGLDRIRFYTGGEKGVVKIWDGREGNVLFSLGTERSRISDEHEEQRQITDVLYLPSTSSIVAIHADQNIIFHSLTTQSLTRQLIGFNDEIVDAAFLSPQLGTRDSHVALATNSSLIRVYSSTSLDARLLEGHTDIVLTLDHGPGGQILASGGKDRSARLWAPLAENDGRWGYGCVAICEGHAGSIGAIALSRKTEEHSPNNEYGRPVFMATGSQDRTIKLWDLSVIPLTCDDLDNKEPFKCHSLTTHKAHDKDINALDIAPNDQLLVSGSQDRTAKIYQIEFIPASKSRAARGELKLIGTCKGHKRGVWSVRFGRSERVLATGSGDKTIKLWNLEDFTCVKTFEGHTNSVLRVDFLNLGMQLVSAASDGLVKLWNVRDEECITTLDNHEDKVWALAISADEKRIVSGGADSVVTFWEDCTEEQQEEKETKRAEMVLKEQDFLNYLSLNDYRRAIELALAMEQPGRLLALFKDVRSNRNNYAESESSVTGHPSVDEVIRTLAGSDLAKLLQYVRDWNTNARTSVVAQGVLYAIMKLRSAEEVIKSLTETPFESVEDGVVTDVAGKGSTALKELMEGLIPYSERHLARMERLVQESYMVDYILGEMDDGMFDGDLDDEDTDMEDVLS